MPPRFGIQEWQLAYKVALQVLKRPDLAEDAAQEAMLRAYRARGSFAGKARFESWLHRIALNTALSLLRRPHYRLRYSAPAAHDGREHPLDQIEAPGQSPEDAAGTAQLAARVDGCLRCMRESDRVAFTERFLYGTSERELGRILGVSTNAAKQRAFRARRTVRRCVEDTQAPPKAALS